MRRKLLAAWGICKQAYLHVLLPSSVLFGCASAAPPKPPRDPYGERVQGCIDAPRPLSDAAHTRMVRLPAGMAVLGSTPQERAQAQADYGPGGSKHFVNETAVRRAHVAGFSIDATPVTNATYAEFVAACGAVPPDVEALSAARWDELQREFGLTHDYAIVHRFLWNDSDPPPERGRHPAVLVSYDDAAFYCAWRGARLPTDVEWERAARGPSGSIYPWGSRHDAFRVNTGVRGPGDTLEVGAYPHGTTAEGIADMGGHVYEWTGDRVGKSAERVVKGNGWDGRGGYGRGAARLARPAAMRDVTLGFRCASSR